MKRYKKFYSAGKLQDKTIRSIPVNVSIEEVLADTEEAIRRVGEEAGLAVMNMVMENDRERILRSGRWYRHGAQPGTACLEGRKVNIESLRSRTCDGSREIPLKSYAALQLHPTSAFF
jgi:hypothetical protein